MLKRAIALLNVLLMTAALSGCDWKDQHGSESESENSISTESIDLSGDMKVEQPRSYTSIPVYSSFSNAGRIVPMGEQFAIYSDYEYYEENRVLIYDPEQAAVITEILYDYSTIPVGVMESDEGCQVILRNTVERGENRKYQYFLETYDTSWNLLGTEDITSIFGEETYIKAVVLDGSERYAVLTGTNPIDLGLAMLKADNATAVAFYDQSFQLLGRATNAQKVDTIFVGKDGRVFARFREGDFGSIGVFSHDTLVLEPIEAEGMPQYLTDGFAGSGRYDICVYDAGAVYGIDIGKQKADKLVTWSDAEFTGINIAACASLDEGGFLIANDSAVRMMRVHTQEEMAEKQIITIGVLGDTTWYSNLTKQFNWQNENIYVEIKEYPISEGYADPGMLLEQDILSGEGADIFCTNNGDVNFYTCAAQGAFADLYPFMEADTDFHEEDYFMNFFESMEYEDKLCRLSWSYRIATVAAKTEHVGSESGKTISEYLDLLENLPDGMEPLLGNSNSISMFSLLSLYGQCSNMDFVNRTCNFNTPEFLRTLEYCSTLPPRDTEAVSSVEMLQNDTALLAYVYLMSPYQYYYISANDFDNAEVTWLGMPTLSGNGSVFQPVDGLAISAYSKHQEEAWEFLKYLLSEEYQNTLYMDLPVRRSAMQRQMAAAMDPLSDQNTPAQVTETEVGAATQESMDAFYAFVEGISEYHEYDMMLESIAVSGAEAYFQGERTADEAVQNIQSEVNAYLSGREYHD